MNNAEIAKLLLGIPFLDGGRDFDGADCYGVVMLYARELGITLPDAQYDRGWFEQGCSMLIDGAPDHATEINKGDIESGDLIMFKNHPKSVNHIGIYLGEDRFLHSLETQGTVIQRLSTQPYSRRAHSFFRLKQPQ